jgi:hypothetical protein
MLPMALAPPINPTEIIAATIAYSIPVEPSFFQMNLLINEKMSNPFCLFSYGGVAWPSLRVFQINFSVILKKFLQKIYHIILLILFSVVNIYICTNLSNVFT